MGFRCDQLLVFVLYVFCITPSLNSCVQPQKKSPNKANHSSEATVTRLKEKMITSIAIKTNNY